MSSPALFDSPCAQRNLTRELLSDIYIVSGPDEERRVLKIHRLGRISFRAVKEKRDYMGKRKSASWMYLSKLAAMKEYAFMQVSGHLPRW